nr:RecName: Full=Fibrinogen beta chain; Contains: RecName: Full=Fibrinopeptide B [Ceratotherium simum]prf//721948E fibrinopeptide B [Bitis nasicornis]
HDDKAAVDAR